MAQLLSIDDYPSLILGRMRQPAACRHGQAAQRGDVLHLPNGPRGPA
jgi:hypothetical protein